jgi:hypothetical protein
MGSALARSRMVVVRTVLEIAQQPGIQTKIDRLPMKRPTLGWRDCLACKKPSPGIPGKFGNYSRIGLET